MFDLFCVTNRRLCSDDFLRRIEVIARQKPSGVILREKDLPENEYLALARDVIAVCVQAGVPCILHRFPGAAAALGQRAIHLPLPVLRALPREEKAYFHRIGVSCHSAAEVREAETLGCTYVTAGHIFETDCKKDLAGRGLPFLREVCGCTGVPVYAIGGIAPQNLRDIKNAGAAGACLMSSLMTCCDPAAYFHSLREKIS